MEAENTARLVAVTPAGMPEGVVLREMIVTRLLVEWRPKTSRFDEVDFVHRSQITICRGAQSCPVRRRTRASILGNEHCQQIRPAYQPPARISRLI